MTTTGTTNASPLTTTGTVSLDPKPTSIFGPDQLAKHVHDAFSGVPSHKTKVLIGYWTLDGKYRLTYAQRIGDSWEMGATFGKDSSDGNISGGIYVKGAWIALLALALATV